MADPEVMWAPRHRTVLSSWSVGLELALPIFAGLCLFVVPRAASGQKEGDAATNASGSRPAPPVVALSAFSLRGVQLSAQVAGALGDLLQAKLAASGVFRMIPNQTVGGKLAKLRRAGVRGCSTGECPMRLGQALAASQVIQPQLVGFDKHCMVVLTLYDVRSATASLATTEECSCKESGFLAASLKAVTALSTAFRQRSGSKTRSLGASPSAKGAKVSIFVDSKPSYQPIWVDGKRVGKTPKLLAMNRGLPHRLKVGVWPYRPVERKFTPRGWQRLKLRLRLDRDDAKTVATTREWIGFGFLGGWAPAADEPLIGAELRILQWRWPHLVWTAFEGRFAVAVSGDEDETRRPLNTIVTIATRVAYLLYWGRYGTHQLQLGLGAGYWHASFSYAPSKPTGRSAFALLPSLDYLYLLGNGGLSVGLGINVGLPMRGDLGQRDSPLTLSIGLKFGLSPEPTMRAQTQGKVPAHSPLPADAKRGHRVLP